MKDRVGPDSKPNDRIKPFGALVGEWATVSTHPMLPGKVLHGRVTFDWIEDGAFLRMRSSVEGHDVPSGVAIIGSDDVADEGSMLYFDERGVSRVYRTSFSGNEWKLWRDAPGFRQRGVAVVSPAGDSIQARWELARDGGSFEPDLEQTYTRVEAKRS